MPPLSTPADVQGSITRVKERGDFIDEIPKYTPGHIGPRDESFRKRERGQNKSVAQFEAQSGNCKLQMTEVRNALPRFSVSQPENRGGSKKSFKLADLWVMSASKNVISTSYADRDEP